MRNVQNPLGGKQEHLERNIGQGEKEKTENKIDRIILPCETKMDHHDNRQETCVDNM
jgi:hypothetical protein